MRRIPKAAIGVPDMSVAATKAAQTSTTQWMRDELEHVLATEIMSQRAADRLRRALEQICSDEGILCSASSRLH